MMDREQVEQRREEILDVLYKEATSTESVFRAERIAAAAAYLSHTWAIVDPPGGRPPGAGRRVLQSAGARAYARTPARTTEYACSPGCWLKDEKEAAAVQVLIACEYSGRERDAFIDAGHEAWSADLLPGEGKYRRRHFQGNVLPLLREPWDLVIAHPPCTYLGS